MSQGSDGIEMVRQTVRRTVLLRRVRAVLGPGSECIAAEAYRVVFLGAGEDEAGKPEPEERRRWLRELIDTLDPELRKLVLARIGSRLEDQAA